MVTVLHVTDRFGGGVATAIASYLRNAPAGTKHHLLSATPPGVEVQGLRLDKMASSHTLPENTLMRIAEVRKVVNAIGPDYIHAHSSFGGAIVRMAVRNRASARIIYSPHCYAFERADTRWSWLYLAIERVLARNTERLAACSRREARLSVAALPYREAQVVSLPNVVPQAGVRNHASPTSNLRVVAAGRLARQKDPSYFADAVDEIRSRGVEVEAVWIGDGDGVYRDELLRRGVQISGWLPAEDLVNELANAHLYLHTAEWEGFPLTVLEAAAVETPQLVRPVSGLEDVSTRRSIDGGLGEFLTSWVEGSYEGWRAQNVREWSEALGEHNDESQSAALARIYELV